MVVLKTPSPLSPAGSARSWRGRGAPGVRRQRRFGKQEAPILSVDPVQSGWAVVQSGTAAGPVAHLGGRLCGPTRLPRPGLDPRLLAALRRLQRRRRALQRGELLRVIRAVQCCSAPLQTDACIAGLAVGVE